MKPVYRIAVLADVHANLPALEAVLTDLDQYQPLDGILVAGDFGYGPNPVEAIQLLTERNVIAVLGNGDVDLLNFADGQSPEYTHYLKQFSLIRWSLAHSTPETLGFLRSLPEQRVYILPGAPPIRLMHGSPRSINESVSAGKNQLAELLKMVEEPVIIFGHTHEAWVQSIDCRLAMNPGSVSAPVNEPSCARYAIMEWYGSEQWQVFLHCLAYSPERIQNDFKQSGLIDIGPLGRALLETVLTGKRVGVAFMRYASRLARQMNYEHLPYIPDEVFERAADTFDWQML